MHTTKEMELLKKSAAVPDKGEVNVKHYVDT